MLVWTNCGSKSTPWWRGSVQGGRVGARPQALLYGWGHLVLGPGISDSEMIVSQFRTSQHKLTMLMIVAESLVLESPWTEDDVFLDSNRFCLRISSTLQ
ncbi:hypothetical protein J6590_035523 [Homalodisca vitripennis]|nr:hypothetical protein J6590_035523 [Homalodisca vitripennis]